MPAMIWFWAVIFVAALVLEASTPTLVCIWFALGALGAGVCALCNAALWVQIAVFLVLTIAALIATRPLAKKIADKKLATNADRNIGAEAKVIKAIGPHQNGEVKVGGLVWVAMSENGESFEEGDVVTVKEIRGVKLIVAKN